VAVVRRLFPPYPKISARAASKYATERTSQKGKILACNADPDGFPCGIAGEPGASGRIRRRIPRNKLGTEIGGYCGRMSAFTNAIGAND
jgi:hypothetical protein